MPLYIKDDETAALVTDLARRLKTTKQEAVRIVVQAELDRLAPQPSLRDRLAAFYEEFPKPEPTGLPADKAFYDELSGEFD